MPNSPTPARPLLALAAAAALVAAPLTLAQETEPAPAAADETIAISPQQLLAALRGSSEPAKPDADDYAPFEKVTEGMKAVTADEGETGLFTIYHVTDEDARDPSKLLAAIPRGLIGDDLLLATSIASGPMAGYQWNDYLVRFERRGRNLVLMVPDLRYRGSGPIQESVERTYKPAILVSLPIVTTSPGGEIVVDMTPLVMGGAIDVPGGFGRPDRDLSQYPKLKVFPDNVLIEAEQVYGGRGSAQSVGVSFAFRKLPNLRNSGDRYTPRRADERVGYFLTAQQDWGKRHDAKDLVNRYINRWRLEKLDSSLDLSPPAEPIVFYIEKTVPVQWRRYVRDGIEEWNKAFEQIGIVGAIEVRQQTDTAYADVDPEDARYNFIRWIVTGRGFAMGPSRVDPRTGQILDADIIFDDAMLRYFSSELDLLGPKALARDAGPDTLAFWQENPAFRPMGMTEADVDQAAEEYRAKFGLFAQAGSNFASDEDPNAGRDAQQLLGDLAGHDGHGHGVMPQSSRLASTAGLCDYATGARRQLAVTHLAWAASQVAPPMPKVPTTKPGEDDEKLPDDVKEAVEEAAAAADDESAELPTAPEAKTPGDYELPEKYLGLVLKEIVAHEVGHTIGLRHNFKASSWLSLEEAKARRGDPTKPTVASVMDYNPVLIFAEDDLENLEAAETFITPVIGPYDMWAVEYGYGLHSRGEEAKKLAEIAGRAGEKALQYATDEDTRGLVSPDPYANRYDMGDDPLAWAKSRVELADKLMATIEEWAVEENEPNEYLRRAFNNTWYEKTGAMYYVARLVGGQTFSRARFDDEIEGGDPAGLAPLDPAVQRAALDYLKNTLFADGFLEVDPQLLNKLVPTRMPGIGSYAGGEIDFPIHNATLAAQNRALSAAYSPTVIQRVYDAELKTIGDDKFTVAELLRGVTDSVWTGLDAADKGSHSNADPLIDSVRRNLQLQHVGYLVAMVDAEAGKLTSADVQNMARHELRRMSGELAKALEHEADLDLASAAHLSETRAKIERVLNAPHLDVAAGGGGQTVIIMGQTGQ